jgi:NADH:ubiquinone oxidoreductase subunit 5 (subunit L)/multisubunit Na+/H+ antiporter MnhA subunit
VKADKAIDKAETALVKANSDLEEARVGLSTSAARTQEARTLVSQLEEHQPDLPPRAVTAVTAATDAGDLADLLPESYANRASQHPHESPWTMTVPLVLLSFFAVLAGVINLPFSTDLHFLEHWLEPSLFGNEAEVTATAGVKWALAGAAVAVGLVAIVSAFAVYLRGRATAGAIERPVLAKGWFVDQGYAAFFGGPGRMLFDAAAWFDRTIIDGIVRGVAFTVQLAGTGLRTTQSGFVRSYALGIGVGAAFVMAWFLGRMFA